jgi:hypothetical protein
MTELKAIFELYNMLDELKPLVELGEMAFKHKKELAKIVATYSYKELEQFNELIGQIQIKEKRND